MLPTHLSYADLMFFIVSCSTSLTIRRFDFFLVWLGQSKLSEARIID